MSRNEDQNAQDSGNAQKQRPARPELALAPSFVHTIVIENEARGFETPGTTSVVYLGLNSSRFLPISDGEGR
jgi:hypothetical protein